MNKLDLQSLIKMKEEADDIYYNTGDPSPLTDEEYDNLKEMIERKTTVNDVGCVLRNDANRVKLPIQMWSMDKITNDEKKLQSFLLKNNNKFNRGYVIEEKLDGVSCLIVFDGTKNVVKLFTRGDGIEGADISYLSQFIKGIPTTTFTFMVRGELIIEKNVFEEKYSSTSANARNMVSGCVNAKTKRVGVEDIRFIAYELVENSSESMSPLSQLIWLASNGFDTVKYRHLENVNVNILGNSLTEMREESLFEMDGIILQPESRYYRCDTSNPTYAVAFKMPSAFAETTVVNVLWEVTKWKLLKPRVEIVPVRLEGVVIQYITAYNAKYVVDNNLGPGAIVRVTRAGNVIPKIVTVIQPSPNIKMPDAKYKWNDTKVDLIVDEEDILSGVKMTSDFFIKIGVKGVGQKTIERLYMAGFDSLFKILAMKENDFKGIDGFGDVSAKNTFEAIENGCKNLPLDVLLSSSGIFGNGFGNRMITLLLAKVPNVFDDALTNERLTELINEVEGFSSKNTSKIIEHLPKAKQFLHEIKKFIHILPVVEKIQSVENSFTYVFSGFRDSILEKKLTDAGHKVAGTVSKSVNFVVVPSLDYTESSKTTKAKDLGITIIDKNNINL